MPKTLVKPCTRCRKGLRLLKSVWKSAARPKKVIRSHGVICKECWWKRTAW